ncbi:hypothetical protein [Paractinoplanes lichenicola]|uniref:S-layer protein C-terminal domain-containing protein n=1 Tax=Paractinoplanes lichenicola TaxID=2802976 RepID=A0ABS1VXU2_9ACTN|nr:hypothetical protein [Actinoplanes lichenicola]MBL7259285.1 hypothetical protein [Actinoplanes lichenicola]
MDDVRDVVINLVAAAIGAAAAWSVARFKRWRRERRSRRFWGGMATRGVTVVIGAQDPAALGRWEPSGLVGMGDAMALITLQRELEAIGCRVDVRSAEALAPEHLERDLLLLGGPDANKITRDTLEHYDQVLKLTVPGFKSHEVAIRDTRSDRYYAPRKGADDEWVLDYGLLVRLPNPLSNGRRTEVLILAGCWGYGTEGAAKAVSELDFLKEVGVKKNRFFEALVRTTVRANVGYYQRPELIRPLEVGEW